MQNNKKQHLATIIQLSLAAITFVTMLSGGFWLMGEKELARKVLTFGLIPLIAWFGGVITLYLGQDSVDIVPESVEIAQEPERIMPSIYGVDDEKLHFVNVVIDGDTIKVDGDVRVRLIGIDAPEKDECYYKESTSKLADLIQGEYIRLEKDISGADQNGRLLRYVILPSENIIADDLLVNNYMVRYGYAKTKSIAPDIRYRTLFKASHQIAADSKEGLWGACVHEIESIQSGRPNDPPRDPNCIIKGNVSTGEYGKIYFMPECPNYDKVKISFASGEQYFCTEQDAIDAGFKRAFECP